MVGGGQNLGTIPVTPWAIIYVRPGPLVRHASLFISIYKMNYHTDIVNFQGTLIEEGHLLERGAYFENLTFGVALFRDLEGRSLDR